jgi:lytic murein transglycosylase
VLALAVSTNPAEARPSFKVWLAGLWPQAEALGVSRATFEQTFRGVTPDFSIPDLKKPGQKTPSSRGQAEFTRPPSAYLNRAYLSRLAKTGQALAKKHKTTLDRIEKEIGVSRHAVLAIWGRETAFGAYKLKHDAIRVLATLAYAGRRSELFRNELLDALRLIEGGMDRKRMRSSWAGAIGLTQFMPSEFFKHARDFDGDGKVNLFTSVPDALASAAQQMAGKGWVTGQTWGYEVVIPPTSDCALEGPTQARPLSDWIKLGFKRAANRPWPQKALDQEAYLMLPAGAYGPAFLALENFRVFRRYNMSDLYAVFVGHLADRIAGGGDFVTPWSSEEKQRTDVIAGIQERLKTAGYGVSIVDGKIGSNTRMVVGAYQRNAGLKVDCWPSPTVLNALKRSPPPPPPPPAAGRDGAP